MAEIIIRTQCDPSLHEALCDAVMDAALDFADKHPHRVIVATLVLEPEPDDSALASTHGDIDAQAGRSEGPVG